MARQISEVVEALRTSWASKIKPGASSWVQIAGRPGPITTGLIMTVLHMSG